MRAWAALATVAVGGALAAPALAADGVVLSRPEVVVLRQGQLESCALAASGYRELEVADEAATFLLEGAALGEGGYRVVGKGISRVSWAPEDGETRVTVEFASPPAASLINAVGGTELRPQLPQVIAGFTFDGRSRGHGYPVMGTQRPRHAEDEDIYGSYELPEFPEVRYSDALVTLRVRNVDFRDVLWLMSEIGGVSIVLDPYWADEPTGSRRPPGGGADPGAGGGTESGPGFRGAGDYIPAAPREGTGLLSLNFEDVPFDLALDLIIMSVGLVKVDIWPGSFD